MIYEYMGIKPKIEKDVFVADSADVIGKVEIDSGSSIWFNVTIRGDVGYARIGKNTSIQDNSCIHMTNEFDAVVGNNVTVGHSATIHGCTIGDNTLVGMGATILDNAKIGKNSIVAGGAVVLEGAVFEDNSLIAGVPAKVRRKVSNEEAEYLVKHAQKYVDYAKGYIENPIKDITDEYNLKK
ncbi:MAG: gamma carbonic anhydrase family protein [Candidatus Cloacimonadota bacterium]|nr:MAG: gamma carbonic anhydrase family protein [Candidatus Cloacimonadota bacterium]PIE80189.1 MAG: gamma carbonic anhydrase family protein [Candidatus Delongbacteria bacterium]